MVLVMPSDGLWRDGSGFLPHKGGCDYEKWIVEDVPDAVRQEIKITSSKSSFICSPVAINLLLRVEYSADVTISFFVLAVEAIYNPISKIIMLKIIQSIG